MTRQRRLVSGQSNRRASALIAAECERGYGSGGPDEHMIGDDLAECHPLAVTPDLDAAAR